MPITKTICIFCGAKKGRNDRIIKLATIVGKIIARKNINLVCGGGNTGLMSIVTAAAVSEGGFVTGILSDGLKSEVPNTNSTKLIKTPCLQTRKKVMIEIADAFLILPGGYGTLDEFFEIMVLYRIAMIKKPIVLFNYLGFWDDIIKQMDRIQQEGFLRQHDSKAPIIVNNIEEFQNWLSIFDCIREK
ncbi:TIGR00730 family Rossman fold protein [Candidatus Lariskella endosymbiont of Hedychridium roseum]|uniref:LOG family protein n=1 Tax=Candidatus Lariskella endosymbiont of Hedychridium roseum TaxID=3077949 RepID=UPI0030D39E0C